MKSPIPSWLSIFSTAAILQHVSCTVAAESNTVVTAAWASTLTRDWSTSAACSPPSDATTNPWPSSIGRIQGFNYGQQNMDPTKWNPKIESAWNLIDIPHDGDDAKIFRDVKLYSMMPIAGSTATYNEAIGQVYDDDFGDGGFAKGKELVRLMLGMWISGGDGDYGDTPFAGELAALKAFIAFIDGVGDAQSELYSQMILSIYVGSEDLYRWFIDDSSNPGIPPWILVERIQSVRAALAASTTDWLKKLPVGHVDTFQLFLPSWDGFYFRADPNQPDPAKGQMKPSQAALYCDFWGANAFPYWQDKTKQGDPQKNSIDVALPLFQTAYLELLENSCGRHVLIGETGWPTWMPGTGSPNGDAVANVPNSLTYYRNIYCGFLWKLSVDTFWHEFSVWPGTVMTDPGGDWAVTALASDPMTDADEQSALTSKALYGKDNVLNCAVELAS